MAAGEHHLNTGKLRPEVQNENCLNSIARKRSTKTLCSLLSFDSRFPKLDVAGSTPVSRSIFSTIRQICCKSQFRENGFELRGL